MLDLNKLTNDVSFALCKFWPNLIDTTSYMKKFLLSKYRLFRSISNKLIIFNFSNPKTFKRSKRFLSSFLFKKLYFLCI